MARYFNIDRYERKKYGLVSIYILLFDTNSNLIANNYNIPSPHKKNRNLPKIENNFIYLFLQCLTALQETGVNIIFKAIVFELTLMMVA